MLDLYTKLETEIYLTNSRLCVGLDPDFSLLAGDTPLDLNVAIIDATAGVACAYKPNLAMYEVLGEKGHDTLTRTIAYIRKKAPRAVIIGDAKRGDIGICGEAYAKALFNYGFDAVTVNPYMGDDALKPFLNYRNIGVFVLCRTSNPSASTYQDMRMESGMPLYLHVAERMNAHHRNGYDVGLVLGATSPFIIRRVREICPTMPFLIPGVGVQGGDIDEVAANARDRNNAGYVVNVSRQIMHAAKDTHGLISLDGDAVDRMCNVAIDMRNRINAAADRYALPTASRDVRGYTRYDEAVELIREAVESE